MDITAKAELNNLRPVEFDPGQFPETFRQIQNFRLDALVRAFDFRELNIDYFHEGDQEIQVPGTEALLVTADTTNTIPLSEGRDVAGEQYLAYRIFLVRTVDDQVYCFGSDERGLPLEDWMLDHVVITATGAALRDQTANPSASEEIPETLERPCRKCGQTIPAGEEFCPNCTAGFDPLEEVSPRTGQVVKICLRIVGLIVAVGALYALSN